MSNIRERVRTFLEGTQRVLALVGPSGTGKLYATQQAARDAGLACVEHDRAQGVINYDLWGATTLANGGLARTLNILCNADSETDFSFVARMPQGRKVVCIANDGQALAKAKIPIERVKTLTPHAMAKILFLEHDWDALAAQRLSRLAQGDWRQVFTARRALEGASIDIGIASEEEVAQALVRMTRDKALEAHPTLRVHQLFNGHVRDNLEDYACPDVLAWGERNLGVTCDALEDMAAIQEAAVTCDVLLTGGEYDVGLDHFARSAACLGRRSTKLRYDCAAFVNPWAVPAAGTALRDPRVRESAEQQLEPWSKRMKRRLVKEQTLPDEAPKRGRRTKAKRTATPTPKAIAQRATTKGEIKRGQATSRQ